MKIMRVDPGVLLLGVRLVWSPFCLEVFVGRKGVLLAGTDATAKERALEKACTSTT